MLVLHQVVAQVRIEQDHDGALQRPQLSAAEPNKVVLADGKHVLPRADFNGMHTSNL